MSISDLNQYAHKNLPLLVNLKKRKLYAVENSGKTIIILYAGMSQIFKHKIYRNEKYAKFFLEKSAQFISKTHPEYIGYRHRFSKIFPKEIEILNILII